MSLTNMWLANKQQLTSKRIHQVISFAGGGKLLDGGDASAEFREFLSHIPAEMLEQYSKECLGEEKFSDNGSALQDIINEIGKRIGFKIDHGLYRGRSNDIGFDGLWHTDDGWSIVVEVKTTDTYSIALDTISEYRRKLIAGSRIKEDKSSILIIVGRSDTGSLEAQVRGSRHAWDIRLISVEALVSLMKIKQELDHPDTIRKILAVLTPKEFTKVDAIVDLVFSTTTDVRQEQSDKNIDEPSDEVPKFHPVNFRDACIERVQKAIGQPLVKRSFAFYSSADEHLGICCINSRGYTKTKHIGYWFAFHPHQKESLEAHQSAFIALGCGSEKDVLLIPFVDFNKWLSSMNRTENSAKDGYWHVRVKKEGLDFHLMLKSPHKPIDVSKYLLSAKVK